MGIQTNTIKVDGTGDVAHVAVFDSHRKYLGLYAQSGSCVVSIGDGTHADMAITIAQGNIFEPDPGFTEAVYYTGVGTTLLVITDAHRPTVLTYDDVVLTYDGTALTYQNDDQVRYLAPPVFV